MPNLEIVGDFADKPTSSNSGTGKSTSFKKLLKKKPFMIALGVVALIGIYVWYKSNSSVSSDTVAYTASGYTGYPIIDSGSSYGETQTAYNTDTMYAMQEAFQSQLDNLQTVYDNNTENLVSQVVELNERFNTTEEVVKSQSEVIEMQNTISAMQYNSDRALLSTSQAEKDALHEANKAMAYKYGWSFADGYWYDADGNRLYQTATQSSFASKNQTKSSASSATPASITTVKTVNATTGNSGLGGKTASSAVGATVTVTRKTGTTGSGASKKSTTGTITSGSSASKKYGVNIEGNVFVPNGG